MPSVGIDLSAWVDNSASFKIPTPNGLNVVVQDLWSFDDNPAIMIPQKAATLLTSLGNSASDPTLQWHISFASATDNLRWLATPKNIAVGYPPQYASYIDGVNDYLFTFLTQYFNKVPGAQGRFGTILMDFPEAPNEDLVAAIVLMNG
jgi:hypothetical protein